jgi:hypothetical protein
MWLRALRRMLSASPKRPIRNPSRWLVPRLESLEDRVVLDNSPAWSPCIVTPYPPLVKPNQALLLHVECQSQQAPYQTISNYTGTMIVTDERVTLPRSPTMKILASHTFSEVNAGRFTFIISLKASQTIYVTDTEFFQGAYDYRYIVVNSSTSVSTSRLTLVNVVQQPPNHVKEDADPGFNVSAIARDQNGRFMSGVTLSLSFDFDPNGGTTHLSGTLSAVTDASGKALFKNVSIDMPGEGFVLRVTNLDGSVEGLTYGFDVEENLDPDIWTGGGKTNKWSDDDNWSNAAPQDGQDIYFPAGVAKLATMNDMPDLEIGSFGVAGNYTFGGAKIYVEGDLSIFEGSPVFNLPISFDPPPLIADSTLRANAAAPNPDDHPHPIQVGNTNTDAADQMVPWQGSKEFEMLGPGMWRMLGAGNSFSGGMTLKGGTLVIDSASDLGTGPLTIDSPGIVTLVCAKPIILPADKQINVVGGKLIVVGSLTINGPIAVSGNGEFDSGAGTVSLRTGPIALPGSLTLNGTLTTGTNTLGIGYSQQANYSKENTSLKPGQITLGSQFNGAGKIEIESKAIVYANGAGGYSGVISLNGGTLKLGPTPNALGQATLELIKTSTLQATAPVTLPNKLTLLNGNLQFNGNITLSGNLISKSKGEQFETLNAASQVHLNGAFTADIAGNNVVLGSGRFILEKTYTAPQPAPGILIVDGATLTSKTTFANNSFPITLVSGTIEVGANMALGTGALTLGAQAAPTRGTLKALQKVQLDNDVNCDWGGTLEVVGSMTLAGGVNVKVNTEFDVDKSATLTITGKISGMSTLTIGTGLVAFGGKVATRVQINTGATAQALAALTADVSIDTGSVIGSFLLEGGTFKSSQTNRFYGAVTANKGAIILSGTDPLGFNYGSGNRTQLQVGSINGPVTIGVTGAVTLNNLDASFPKGKVTLKSGSLTIPAASLAGDGELTVANNANLTLGDATHAIGGAGSTTLSGPGTLHIAGALAPTITVNSGTLELELSAAGAGPIEVKGGKLAGNANTLYKGDITFTGGNLAGAGNAPFGTGLIAVNQGANLTVGGATVLGNAITVNSGGILNLGGTVTVNGRVRVVDNGVINANGVAPVGITFGQVDVIGGRLATNGIIHINGPASVDNSTTKGTLGTAGNVTFASTVLISGGFFGATGTFAVNGTTTFADGNSLNLGAAATYLFAGNVSVQTAALLWQGRITVTGTFQLTRTTTLTAQSPARISISGGIIGDQELDLTGFNITWRVHSDIGNTFLVAGRGAMIQTYLGFVYHGRKPEARGGKIDESFSTTPFPGP